MFDINKLKKLFVFGLFLFLSVDLFADFSFYWRDRNYFLSEIRSFNTLDLDHDSPADFTGNVRTFSTLKLRMKPSLGITDRLAIHATFDTFTNPFSTVANEGGALQGQQAPDTNNYGPQVSTLIPRGLFGGASGFGHSALTRTTGGSIHNLLVKDAYLEYLGDWGILRIGRIPRHWGLGIHFNSGENASDKFADRTDSLLYELGLGNAKLGAIYSKILENNIDSNGDDVTQLEGYLFWNDPEKDVDTGVLYTFLKSSEIHMALSYIDVFLIKKFQSWKAGIEVVASHGYAGTVSGNKASQVGVAGELSYKWTSSLENYLKLGYASAPDRGKTEKLTTFAFNRNYDIALIMFNQGVGAIPAETGVSASSEPDANAIFAAYYANLGANYNFSDRLGTNLNFAYAHAPLSLSTGGKKEYGGEVDLSLWYRFLENLSFTVSGGLFKPGKLYEGSPTNESRTLDLCHTANFSATLLF